MVEALWKRLEKGLKQVAKGQSTELDIAEVQRLVTEYTAHRPPMKRQSSCRFPKPSWAATATTWQRWA